MANGKIARIGGMNVSLALTRFGCLPTVSPLGIKRHNLHCQPISPSPMLYQPCLLQVLAQNIPHRLKLQHHLLLQQCFTSTPVRSLGGTPLRLSRAER